METFLIIITAALFILYIIFQRREINTLKKDIYNCNEAFKDLLEKYKSRINEDDYDLEGWND